jgi:hypothetical protein
MMSEGLLDGKPTASTTSIASKKARPWHVPTITGQTIFSLAQSSRKLPMLSSLRRLRPPGWQANGRHAKDVLFEGQYRKAKAKGECPNTKAAVLIDGKGAAVFSISARPRNATFTIA